MTHKKTLILGALLSVACVAALGSTTWAHDSDSSEHMIEHTAQKQRLAVEQESTSEQKQALIERFEAAKETRMNKLEDKRLEVCKKHQTKINDIQKRSTTQSTKQLAVFQKIEDKVKQFYIDKHLTVDGYDAAVANADAKKVAALAAIEASSATTFSCDNADGANPGAAVKELMQTRHDAIKAYRTAVKDLIVLVKKANGQQTNADKPASTGEEQ